ncbi:MAG TPA: hypothetical protein VFE72_06740 [Lysobacter sp.]|nr:hypothetical protein [Lysobacter sp.]
MNRNDQTMRHRCHGDPLSRQLQRSGRDGRSQSMQDASHRGTAPASCDRHGEGSSNALRSGSSG